MKKILVLVIAMTLGVASYVFAAEINDQLEINGEIRANYLTMKAAVNGKSYESYLRTRLKWYISLLRIGKLLLWLKIRTI